MEYYSVKRKQGTGVLFTQPSCARLMYALIIVGGQLIKAELYGKDKKIKAQAKVFQATVGLPKGTASEFERASGFKLVPLQQLKVG